MSLKHVYWSISDRSTLQHFFENCYGFFAIFLSPVWFIRRLNLASMASVKSKNHCFARKEPTILKVEFEAQNADLGALKTVQPRKIKSCFSLEMLLHNIFNCIYIRVLINAEFHTYLFKIK